VMYYSYDGDHIESIHRTVEGAQAALDRAKPPLDPYAFRRVEDPWEVEE
jgi:hypothetical protein